MQPVKRCWKKSGEKAMKTVEYLEKMEKAATHKVRTQLLMMASRDYDVSVEGYKSIKSKYFELQGKENDHADQE